MQILQLCSCAYSVKSKLQSHSGIAFISGPLCPCLRKREGKTGMQSGVSRDKPEYSSIYSGVCGCVRVCSCTQAVCLLKKTFNRAFITPSMMQTDVLKHSLIQHCAFKPREGSRAILCVLSSRHQLGQNCNMMWEYFNQLILSELR